MKKPDIDDALRAIRAHCLECSGGSRIEVERCLLKDCTLYPYRNVEAVAEKLDVLQVLEGQLSLFSEGSNNG